MKSRKTLLFVAGALAAATLGGCAAYPYNDPYYNGQYYNGQPNGPYYSEYRDGYYYPGYYGPRYYGPPVTLGFGFSYSDHHRHYH